MELNVSEHKGMSVLIYAAKLPSYLYQLVWNLELSKKLGKMIKRKGYKNVLIAGLTALKSMFEFVDDNDGRQIFIQDGTGVEESVHSGSAYGAITAIANDVRTASSSVGQAYPVLYRKEYRTGTGIATNNNPMWYGYMAAKNRFNDADTIAAGKYLCDQMHKTLFGYNAGDIQLISIANSALAMNSTAFGTQGLDEGTYIVFISAVIDGYQRGTPSILDIVSNNTDDKYSLDLTIQSDDGNESKLPRVTAYDIFVASLTNVGADVTPATSTELLSLAYTSYFVERVDLNGDGNRFLTIAGTNDITGGAEKITIAGFATWQTFNPIGFFLYDSTNNKTYRITGATPNGTALELTTTPVVSNAGAATLHFFSRWYEVSDDNKRRFVYDDYYFKAGSEMFTYLDLPAGDFGLTNVQYKYGCMSNKRYFIFGRSDGPFGYFSKVNAPDVFPALNILRLKKEPTGCMAVGRDVMAFSKDSAKRFTVLSNTNAEEDDEFSDIGLVSQKALYQVSDEEGYGFDQRGPWHLNLRQHEFIGEHLKEWWEDNLSETEKSACVVGYNRLKNWVMFSFPTYTTSPYTTGIIFVFDREAQKREGINAWWIYKTDVAIYNFTQADDLHLLAGSTTKILDFNTTGTPTETVATKATLKLMNNPILGNRLHINTVYFDYTSATDTVLVKVSADGAAQESLVLLGDKQAVIKYMCSKLELEISTAASANVVEYGSHLITFQPKRV